MYNQSLTGHPPEVEFYNRYFGTNPLDCPNVGYKETSDDKMDIYVVTFNNPFMVEYQIYTLRHFFKAPFNLIIVDNNNQLYPECSEQVKQICERENVIYLKAPDNYYQEAGSFDPSMKLGTTISWIFHNCVKRREPKYFGILDHDCFLVKHLDIRDYLNEKGMYGRICKNDKGWNLHVTANFFRYDFVKHLPLDFRASHQYTLDTGGANYGILYKHHNPADYELHIIGHRYAKHDVNRKDSVQHYEMIDHCWFHMAASSHDQLVGDGAFKLIYAKGFLDSLLINNNYIP